MFEVVEYNGYYRGAGVGGAITGMGMKYGIIDDPLKNRQDANSPTIRQIIWEWYTSTFRTRLAPGGGILITMTRWHELDLVGMLLDLAKHDPRADQWTVLTLPAIAEEPLADYDERQVGEALWPTRFTLDDLEKTRISLGSYDWNSLYQQRPSPLEGGIFKRTFFKPISQSISTPWRIRYWDKASSTAASAKYTAGVRLAITAEGQVIVEHVVRGQWSTGERRKVMLQTAQTDAAQFGNGIVVFIEQEPGSSGLDSVQDEIRMMAGHAVFADRPSGDKDTRMLPLVAQAEAGNLYMVTGAWNDEFVDELCTIPNGRYRDQADAASGAFNRLVDVINSQDEGIVVHEEYVSISPF
jgi:predicted phage terminase large subunit-like protein